MRFSEELPASTGPSSHVHFEEKLHDSVVMVTPEDDGNFMVKVCVHTHDIQPSFTFILILPLWYFESDFYRVESVLFTSTLTVR